MSKRLDSLAAIATHRREAGDLVQEAADRVLAGTMFNGTPTAADVRWLDSIISVMATLPLDLPTADLPTIASEIMQINAMSATPGFALKDYASGLRIAFVGYAFRDEDDTVSARTFDEVLRTARTMAATYRPRFEARLAESSRT